MLSFVVTKLISLYVDKLLYYSVIKFKTYSTHFFGGEGINGSKAAR